LEQFLGVDGNPMKFAISICQHGGPFVVWGNEESAARRGAEPSCFDVAIGKLVGYVKRDNYLRTSDGRPIIYLMAAEGIVNEKTDAAGQVVGAYEPQGNTIEKFIGMLRSEVQKATGHAPLIVVGANDREYPHQKPDGSMGTVLASAFADAVTRVAPKRGTDALGEDEQKYGLPVICLIDTPGAYPGVGAEERGQAQVIAESMFLMATLPVPVVCVVIGEGGSGGALGIGVGDRVAVLEHAYYSVISPEGCAGILWKGAEHKAEAARALKMRSHDLRSLGVIDAVIEEPPGGAHRDPRQMASRVKNYLVRTLKELLAHTPAALVDARYGKFRAMGRFLEADQVSA
jgi:hypothetical protein